MLIGVGCDLIEIERVKKACDKEAFLSRIYTERERRQAKGDPRVLAGTFAVKEAVAKVFGTGFREFMQIHVEVLRDPLGKPYVELHEGAAKIAAHFPLGPVPLSYFHRNLMNCYPSSKNCSVFLRKNMQFHL